MRMRKKPNLIPRMERCAQVQIKDPKALKGMWRESFADYRELWLELGCGKGRFTAGTAQANPDSMLIAVEKVPDAMVTAMERVCDAGIENIRFIDMDALELGEVFDNAEVGRIFINFCDPWPKSRDAKHRLTAMQIFCPWAARYILRPTTARCSIGPLSSSPPRAGSSES